MQRRGFLGLLGAAVAAPFAPGSAAEHVAPVVQHDAATLTYSIRVTDELVEDLGPRVADAILRQMKLQGARF